MLGFGEGEGREIEKREERQGCLRFGGKRRLVLYLLGFIKDFFTFFFFFLVSEKFFF